MVSKIPLGNLKGNEGEPGEPGPVGPAGPNTVPTQQAVADAITTPGSAAEVAVTAKVEGLIADSPTVVAAATAQVAAVVSGLRLRQTIEYGEGMEAVPHALTVESGPATFGADGLSGAILASDDADDFFDSASVGNFTVEALFKAGGSGDQLPFCHTSFWFLMLQADGTLKLNYNTSGAAADLAGGSDLFDGEQHHVAVVWNASRVPTVFLDGAVAIAGTVPMAAKSSGNTEPFRIGGFTPAYTGYDWLGTIRAVRISNTARYTGTYSPPTYPLPADSATKLMAPMIGPTAYSYVPGLGYPPRPAGDSVRVEWVGPVVPPEMAPLDTWIEVAA